jgi:glycosyltransferase involved in cell wall biosynthesis
LTREATRSSAEGGVLFICSSLGVGGVERLWANLLPGIAERGIPVKLIAVNARGETYDHLEEVGIDVEFLDAGNGIAALGSLPHLIREVKRIAPAALVSFNANAYALAALVGRITSTPSVVNWHQGVGMKWRGTSARACRAAARLGSGVICVSEKNFPDLAELGFAHDRIRVVRNGVPPANLNDPAAKPRSNDAIHVCLAARLAPEKRVDRFIEAIALAAERVPGITATVAGQGPLRDELEALRDKLGAPVEMIGLHPEPTELMLDSDIVCLSSDFETAPVTLMEAAACGRPVVTTGVGGVSQMVADGVTGLIARELSAPAIADLLVELALDHGRRKQMGENARRRWESEFSLEAMVNGYLDLLLNSEGPPLRWPT